MKIIEGIFALMCYSLFVSALGIMLTWPLWLWGYRRGDIGQIKPSPIVPSTPKIARILFVAVCTVGASVTALAYGLGEDEKVPMGIRVAFAVAALALFLYSALIAHKIGEAQGYRKNAERRYLHAQAVAYAAQHPNTTYPVGPPTRD